MHDKLKGKNETREGTQLCVLVLRRKCGAAWKCGEDREVWEWLRDGCGGCVVNVLSRDRAVSECPSS